MNLTGSDGSTRDGSIANLRGSQPSRIPGSLEHLREYLIEAWALGMFMLSAGFIGTSLESLASPVHGALPHPIVRRALMGLAMGWTAIVLIDSPWGRRSGAHMNPATTLVFWRLGMVRSRDALFYVLSQFVGGATGVAVVLAVLGPAFRQEPVRCVATLPGVAGPWVAFGAEMTLTFILMTLVLWVSNSARLHRYTGSFVGGMLLLFITVEAPLSGMSLNPARTLASALWAGAWDSLWIYFAAPPLGMLLAAQLYLGLGRRVYCAKLHHPKTGGCIFRCRFSQLVERRA